mmetsp:Transcript_61924/g.122437  ORF Transcript_61924/g.122437 Transcript_61924/m.122437 type:complete len:131 (+) Transcript_61924:500-892(+)
MLTDRLEVLPLLTRGIEVNDLSGHVCVAALAWGDAATAGPMGTFGLILMSDVVYEIGVVPLLISTLVMLSTDDTEILLAQDAAVGRHAAFDCFRESVQKAGFAWQPVTPQTHTRGKGSVTLVQLRRCRDQ